MNYASPFSTTPLRGPLPVLHTNNSSWRGEGDDAIQLSRRSSRPGASDLDDLDDPGAKGSKAGGDTEPPGGGGGVLQTLPRTSQQSASQRRQQRRRSSQNPVDRMPQGRWAKIKWFFQMQLKYLGPGITMSVAYCDPGNWSTDLQAGSQFGYPLLFVILLTGIFGIILQVLSLRMGIVCNNDLAVLTRKWVMGLGKDNKRNGSNDENASSRAGNLEDPRSTRTRRSLWAHRGRVALLWTLYIVAEGAIICTELAELVGSAIALTLLFPKLPLWGGVIITSADVFLILFVYRPDTKGLRMFELCIGVLVLVVISCLVALVVKVQPHWPDVFEGYLPSSDVVGPQALYVGIGILGATCMPHGLFLGSHFAMFEREEQLVSDLRDTQTAGGEAGSDDGNSNDDDAVSCASHRQPDPQSGLPPPSSTSASALPAKQSRAARLRNAMHRLARSIPGVDPSVLGIEPDPTSNANANKAIAAAKAPRPLPTLRSLNRRLLLSTIDVTASLLLFALTTNSALLIVAAQAFYYGFGRDDQEGGTHGGVVVGDLFEAFSLLSSRLNHASALLFAIALLAAGQSASITVTLAGQVISEGMIKWRTNPFLRRCVTRGITLVPSFVVAAAVGRGGLDRMLVASQVALSMALPFVLVPLLVITAREGWMTVKIREEEGEEDGDTAEENGQRLTATTEEEGATTTATSHGRWARARSWYTHRLMRNRAQPQQRRRASISAYPRSSTSSSSSSDDEAEGTATVAQRSNNATVTVVHYASSWPLVAITFAIFVLICICDVFVLVTSKQSLEGN